MICDECLTSFDERDVGYRNDEYQICDNCFESLANRGDNPMRKFEIVVSQYALIAYYHKVIVSAENEEQAQKIALNLVENHGIEYDHTDWQVNDGFHYQAEYSKKIVPDDTPLTKSTHDKCCCSHTKSVEQLNKEAMDHNKAQDELDYEGH